MRLSIWMFLCIFVFFGCTDRVQETEMLEQKALDSLVLKAGDGKTLFVRNKEESLETQISSLKDLSIVGDAQTLKVLVFFTTWCTPCKGILPHFNNLSKQFSKEVDFFWIPVDDLVGEVENLKSIIQVFSQENLLNASVILDENRKRLFTMIGGIQGVPLIVLYGVDGEYIIHYLGAIPEEMIEFDLTQNLSKKEK